MTIKIIIPGGSLEIMGEPELLGDVLYVKGVHISSEGIAPNDVGFANLRVIAQTILKEMNYDDIRIEGAVRTTGANPGHRPLPFRFARNRGDHDGA